MKKPTRKPAKKKPVKFSQSIANTLCERIGNGESLRSVCLDSNMPCKSAVMKWLGDNVKFVDQYAHARENQADFYADEIIEIADSTDDPAKARLQIDARKWKASRMAPKKYGDRIAQEISGKDGAPLITKIERVIVNAVDGRPA